MLGSRGGIGARRCLPAWILRARAAAEQSVVVAGLSKWLLVAVVVLSGVAAEQSVVVVGLSAVVVG